MASICNPGHQHHGNRDEFYDIPEALSMKFIVLPPLIIYIQIAELREDPSEGIRLGAWVEF
jgi:hypothetical protein